jgi:hypothetical protein
MDNMEKIMQQVIEMLANAEADRKADQEKMATDRKADKEDLLTRMETKIETDKEEMLERIKEKDRQANQELLARMDAYHEKRMAMLDAHQERTMACFGQAEATDFRVNPEENEAVLERQRVHNEETAIHSLKACLSETMECQETTEAHLEYEEPASGDIKDDRNETTTCNEATEN